MSRKPRLLIAEADRTTREMWIDWVRDEYDIAEATTPQEVPHSINRGGYDCIVIDAPLLDSCKEPFFSLSPSIAVVLIRNSDEQVSIEATEVLLRDELQRPLLRHAIASAIKYKRLELSTRNQHESLKVFQRAIHSLPFSVFLSECQQEQLPVVYVNEQFSHLTGYSSEEVRGCQCQFLQGLGADADVLKRMLQAIQQGRSISEEFLNNRKDGTPFWNRLSVAPVRDDNGQITHIVGVQTETTAEKRAAELLRMYSLAIENNPSAIVVTDREGTIQYVNRRFVELTGYSVSECLGKNTRILKSGRHPDAFYKALWQTVLKGEHWHGEICNRKKNGELYWEWGTISPVFDKAGEITHFIAVKEDISNWKRVERILRENEDRFKALGSSCYDLICEIDLAGRILYLSPNSERILGYTEHQLLESDPEQLVHPEDREGFRRCLAEARESGNAQSQVRLRHLDGQWKTLEVSSTAYATAAGTWRIFFIARDITDRLQLEEQFLHSQKLDVIGRLAGGIAHDFNNLLTIIQGFTDFLLSAPMEEEQLGDLLQIRLAADRAADLTRQLLAVSRRQPMRTSILNLNETVVRLTQMMERTVGKHITVETQLDEHLDPVRADAGQIEQVLLNLAVNAKDAMPNGGTLRFETRVVQLPSAGAKPLLDLEPGRYVELAVSDTGTGMDRETLKRLYEPFFTTKEPGKGTGLGLPTAYGIVKQHGGSISVVSEVGEGTTFYVYLPTCSEETVASPAPVTPADARSLEGTETVLLVEDDEGVRKMAERALSDHGYRVLCARFPSEAIRIAREFTGSVALLLMDVVMPEMTGRELFQAIREQHPETSVLFMSGYAENPLVRMDISEETLLLEKPFTAVQLLAKIREVLSAA